MPREATFRSFDPSSGDPVPSFGTEMRRELALDFDSVAAFCNQGGFGVCPNRVIEFRHALFREMEGDADSWFRLKLRARYDRALRNVAEFLGSDPENLVFVPNVTTGLNTAVRACEQVLRGGGEPKSVLRTSLTYHATNFMAEHLTGADGKGEKDRVRLVTAKVEFPIETEEDAVEIFAKAVREQRADDHPVALAIVDHISSTSAIRWPVAKITRELKGLGVERVLVDAAHAPGQIEDLDLEELGRAGVDFYTGNLHKWGLAPRGCAVLWVRPEHQEKTLPNNVSHLHYKEFQDMFFEQGTLDYSNYLATEGSLSFIRSLGGVKGMQSHSGPLLDWAQRELARALGTWTLQVPKSMEAPFIRLIALPELSKRPEPSFNNSMKLTRDFISRHNIAVYLSSMGGRYWLRLSAGIFSTREDVDKIREALVEFCKEEGGL